VGEGVADGQVEPAHHLELEQPEQALHGSIDELRKKIDPAGRGREEDRSSSTEARVAETKGSR
jgi:hypothetical protein